MVGGNDTDPLKAGDHFGDYVVERLLGKGGMGAVYLMRAPDGSRFAVKVMFTSKMSHDLRRRFAREAEFSMKIRHRNLVLVYDVGEDPETGLCYIIMDYVPGGTLSDRIRECGKIPVGDAVKVIMQISDALDVAHRNGLVHRDVKPDNIMFDADGTPKLADLGVAKFDDDRKTMVTLTGMIIGTPAYMSPEQLMDSHKIDARADIYSLGVVLYEMLAGTRPNCGSTAVELLAKAIKGEPLPDIRKLCPEVSAAIAYVLSRMCAPKPEDRPATSVAAAQMLQEAAKGTLEIPKRPPESSVAIAAGRDARRKRMIAIALVIAGLATFLVTGLIGIAYAVHRYYAESPVRSRWQAVEGGARPSAVASAGQQTAEPRKDRNGAAERHVRTAKVNGTTWFYTLKGGEAMIWRGHRAYSEDIKPAFEPYDVERVVVPSRLDGYRVSSIGALAFVRCSRLKAIVIPEGVRCLGVQAFCGCCALERIKLPFTLDIIDRKVFEKCESLESVDIGECPYITGCSFNCSKLARVTVSKTNHEYVDVNGCLLSSSRRELVFFPRTARAMSLLPASVEEIGEGAFICCNSLKRVTIRGKVKKVGALAFASCRNLESVEFLYGVSEIEDRVFANCPNLKSVKFPSSLVRVGTLLFDGCTKLESVRFDGDAPMIDSSESLFGYASDNLKILVKKGSKGWKAPDAEDLPERWPAGASDDSRKILFAAPESKRDRAVDQTRKK
jgi:hypothetical protein